MKVTCRHGYLKVGRLSLDLYILGGIALFWGSYAVWSWLR